MRNFLLNKRFLNCFKKKITNCFLKFVLYFELKLIDLPTKLLKNKIKNIINLRGNST